MEDNNIVIQIRPIQIYKNVAITLFKIFLQHQKYYRFIFGIHNVGFFTLFSLFIILKYMYLISINADKFEQRFINMTKQFWSQIMFLIIKILQNSPPASEGKNHLNILQNKFNSIMDQLLQKQLCRLPLSQFFSRNLKKIIKQLVNQCQKILDKKIITQLQSQFFSFQSPGYSFYSYQKYFRLGKILNYGVILLIMKFFNINHQIQYQILNMRNQFNENQSFPSNKILKFIQIQPQKENIYHTWLYQLLKQTHYKLSHISIKNDLFGFKFLQIRQIYVSLDLRKEKNQVQQEIRHRKFSFQLKEECKFMHQTQEKLKRTLHQNEIQTQLQNMKHEKQEKNRLIRQEENPCISEQERTPLQKQSRINKIFLIFQRRKDTILLTSIRTLKNEQ